MIVPLPAPRREACGFSVLSYMYDRSRSGREWGKRGACDVAIKGTDAGTRCLAPRRPRDRSPLHRPTRSAERVMCVRSTLFSALKRLRYAEWCCAESHSLCPPTRQAGGPKFQSILKFLPSM
jgi:hypothetical protein